MVEEVVVIYIKGSTFMPEDNVIPRETTVMFQNEDKTAYSFSCKGHPTLPTWHLKPGQSLPHRFSKAGKFLITSDSWATLQCVIEVKDETKKALEAPVLKYFPTTRNTRQPASTAEGLSDSSSADSSYEAATIAGNTNHDDDTNNNNSSSFDSSSEQSENGDDEYSGLLRDGLLETVQRKMNARRGTATTASSGRRGVDVASLRDGSDESKQRQRHNMMYSSSRGRGGVGSSLLFDSDVDRDGDVDGVPVSMGSWQRRGKHKPRYQPASCSESAASDTCDSDSSEWCSGEFAAGDELSNGTNNRQTAPTVGAGDSSKITQPNRPLTPPLSDSVMHRSAAFISSSSPIPVPGSPRRARTRQTFWTSPTRSFMPTLTPSTFTQSSAGRAPATGTATTSVALASSSGTNTHGASRALPQSRHEVVIEDFDFVRRAVTATLGDVIHFKLAASVPKHAEHMLVGKVWEDSFEGEVLFESPLMQIEGCASYSFILHRVGQMIISCLIYPDMVCSVLTLPLSDLAPAHQTDVHSQYPGSSSDSSSSSSRDRRRRGAIESAGSGAWVGMSGIGSAYLSFHDMARVSDSRSSCCDSDDCLSLPSTPGSAIRTSVSRSTFSIPFPATPTASAPSTPRQGDSDHHATSTTTTSILNTASTAITSTTTQPKVAWSTTEHWLANSAISTTSAASTSTSTSIAGRSVHALLDRRLSESGFTAPFDHCVVVQDFQFQPHVISASAGQTVQLQAHPRLSSSHSIRCEGCFEDVLISNDHRSGLQNFQYTFSESGTYFVLDDVFRFMECKIVVSKRQPPSAGSDSSVGLVGQSLERTDAERVTQRSSPSQSLQIRASPGLTANNSPSNGGDVRRAKASPASGSLSAKTSPSQHTASSIPLFGSFVDATWRSAAPPLHSQSPSPSRTATPLPSSPAADSAVISTSSCVTGSGGCGRMESCVEFSSDAVRDDVSGVDVSTGITSNKNKKKKKSAKRKKKKGKKAGCGGVADRNDSEDELIEDNDDLCMEPLLTGGEVAQSTGLASDEQLIGLSGAGRLTPRGSVLDVWTSPKTGMSLVSTSVATTTVSIVASSPAPENIFSAPFTAAASVSAPAIVVFTDSTTPAAKSTENRFESSPRQSSPSSPNKSDICSSSSMTTSPLPRRSPKLSPYGRTTVVDDLSTLRAPGSLFGSAAAFMGLSSSPSEVPPHASSPCYSVDNRSRILANVDWSSAVDMSDSDSDSDRDRDAAGESENESNDRMYQAEAKEAEAKEAKVEAKVEAEAPAGVEVHCSEAFNGFGIMSTELIENRKPIPNDDENDDENDDDNEGEGKDEDEGAKTIVEAESIIGKKKKTKKNKRKKKVSKKPQQTVLDSTFSMEADEVHSFSNSLDLADQNSSEIRFTESSFGSGSIQNTQDIIHSTHSHDDTFDSCSVGTSQFFSAAGDLLFTTTEDPLEHIKDVDVDPQPLSHLQTAVESMEEYLYQRIYLIDCLIESNMKDSLPYGLEVPVITLNPPAEEAEI